MLNQDRIQHGLGASMFRVRCLESSPSTNLEIRKAIDEGCPEGFVACALKQESGYGRQGRGWVSPAGGLYFSLLFRPDVPVAQLATLGLVISIAVRETLADFVDDDAIAESIRIKWPNDIICPLGKLCGISLEAFGSSLCVGVGINVFEPTHDVVVGGKNTPAFLAGLKADGTFEGAILDGEALEGESREGEAIEGMASDGAMGVDSAQAGLTRRQEAVLEDLLVRCLTRIEQAYRAWVSRGFIAFCADFNTHAALVGEPVTVVDMTGNLTASGIVERIDEEGRLCLRDDTGEVVAVFTGEVHLV